MKSAAPVPEESGIFQVTMSRNDPPFETNKAGRDRCSVWKHMFSVFHRLNVDTKITPRIVQLNRYISRKALFSFGSN